MSRKTVHRGDTKINTPPAWPCHVAVEAACLGPAGIAHCSEEGKMMEFDVYRMSLPVLGMTPSLLAVKQFDLHSKSFPHIYLSHESVKVSQTGKSRGATAARQLRHGAFPRFQVTLAAGDQNDYGPRTTTSYRKGAERPAFSPRWCG